MFKKPEVFFLIVDHNKEYKAYWDPKLTKFTMNIHVKTAVMVYPELKPSTNYMVTITKTGLVQHHYLFQEVLDPTLIDLLENQ